jgi:hypothetical protein
MPEMPSDNSIKEREEALRAQVLALTLANAPEYKIAEELKLSRYMVRKIRNSIEFKSELKELSEQTKETAAQVFKAQLDELAPLAFAALKRNLQEGKIEGVRVFVEVAGLKDKQEQVQQDSSLHIHLPAGAVAIPQMKEVKSEVEDV